MKSKSSIFILIVVILLVVGGLVYYFAGKGGSTTTSAPTTGLVSTNTGQATGLAVATTGDTAAESTGDQVVSLLRNLSVIQLSDAVFQNPGFAMLEDISITLPPVTNQGRRNPFAPVGSDGISFASATTTGTTPISSTSTLSVNSASGSTTGN